MPSAAGMHGDGMDHRLTRAHERELSGRGEGKRGGGVVKGRRLGLGACGTNGGRGSRAKRAGVPPWEGFWGVAVVGASHRLRGEGMAERGPGLWGGGRREDFGFLG